MRVIRVWGWLAALALCGTANAATATITVLSTSLGQNIYFLKDGVVAQSFAGGIVISVNGMQTSTLCADVFTNIALNDSFQVNLIQPSAVNADPARGLQAAYLYMTQYGRLTSVVNGNSSLTLNQAMSALQLAIWDIVHDGGNGLSAGRIQSSSVTNQATTTAIRNAATQYITFALNNYQNGPTNAQIFQHINGPTVKQQLIGAPEPGALALAIAGLGTLVWRKRRRTA